MNNNTKADFSMLLASSVHDMKNSLGMLLSSLNELMEQHPASSDEHQKHYGTLQGEASRINNDLVQLLGLYRLENDKLSVHQNEVLVLDFLEQQIVRNELLFQARNVLVEVHCEPDLMWFFDDELISGVMNNIIVNAVKYTSSKVLISASMKDGGLWISIEDDGTGYPEVMLDSNTATDQGIDFNSGSTKLGLFFADRIARLHINKEVCGYTQLSNTESGGCFSLFLP